MTTGQKKYAEKLKDTRWKVLRFQIIGRDKRMCCKCRSMDNLDVHHLYYNGNDPWDYPSIALVTLCRSCHQEEHKGKSPIDFTPRYAKSIYSFPYYRFDSPAVKRQKVK